MTFNLQSVYTSQFMSENQHCTTNIIKLFDWLVPIYNICETFGT